MLEISGQETLPVFLSQHVDGNSAADQVQRHFNHALEAARNDRHLPGAEIEHEEEHQHGEQTDQHDPVHLEDGAFKKNRGGEEFRNGRWGELTGLAAGQRHQAATECREQRCLPSRGAQSRAAATCLMTLSIPEAPCYQLAGRKTV